MKFIFALILITLTANASDTIPLLDSNGKTSKIKWNIVNDTVMGGVDPPVVGSKILPLYHLKVFCP